MNEFALRNKLVKALKPHCHVVKMENSAAVGTPDLYICYKGRSAWIELKAFNKPPKNIGQKNPASWKRERLWMKEHTQNGGRVFVVAAIKNEIHTNEYNGQNGVLLHRVIDVKDNIAAHFLDILINDKIKE